MGELLFARALRKIDIPLVTNLQAVAYKSGCICVSWDEPSGDWSGVQIVGKAGSVPESITDGTYYQIAAGSREAVQISVSETRYGKAFAGLANGTTYFFRAFSFYTNPNTGTTTWNTDEVRSVSCTAQEFTGAKQTITQTGTWTVPSGWWRIQYAVIGAGGAGGAGISSTGDESRRGGGGGGSGYMVTGTMDVAPGQQILAVVGAGTTGDGGSSSFGSVTAAGGSKGLDGGAMHPESSYDPPGHGGSGGTGGSGGGIYQGSYDGDATYGGGDSAGNGANGNGSKGYIYGQFTSGGVGDGGSKLFDGVYYCYGGAGGAALGGVVNVASAPGTGPSYWGGSAGGQRGWGHAGADNSGNGGGGGGPKFNSSSHELGGQGGSGVIIILKVA